MSVHQDRDPVFTGYTWTRRLLGAGVQLFYALRGPNDNPKRESIFGRFNVENRPLILNAESFEDLGTIVRRRIRDYNRVRRHSSLGDQPPDNYLGRLARRLSGTIIPEVRCPTSEGHFRVLPNEISNGGLSMPNGGSDCCGTCWFNRINRGERDWLKYRDESIPPHCEIRDLAIEDPFYTYCANHPHRRPDRDPIPIGPVMRHGGWDSGGEKPRYIWKPSPDTEEVRQHLLDLLENFFEHVFKDRYPIGTIVSEVIVWQLGELRENRAAQHIEWISKNCPDHWADTAREALTKIPGGD